MRNTHTKCKTMTRTLNKCDKRFIAYNDVQWKYADVLEQNEEIVEIMCNVKLKGLEIGENYTSDFVCVKDNKELVVIETCYKKNLLKPLTCKMLDASREYWIKQGVKEFILVVGE